MNTDMKLQKVPVEKLKPAKYNPRKDLKPGDPAYEKIKRSMTTYGYVDPVIWNEVTGNIVGGHQRYKVLVAEGVKEMVPFGQGFKDMSPPTKELMRLVLEHKLCHGGHPVLRWNMDNAYVRTDPAGNLKLDKEKSTEKVDGAVALVMALDRAMKNLSGGDSIYNHRGFIVL